MTGECLSISIREFTIDTVTTTIIREARQNDAYSYSELRFPIANSAREAIVIG